MKVKLQGLSEEETEFALSELKACRDPSMNKDPRLECEGFPPSPERDVKDHLPIQDFLDKETQKR